MCCIVKCCNCHVTYIGCMWIDIYGWSAMPRIGVCVCAVGKMAKDIGMTIHKSIVVSFLPCLVSFLAFHSYMFFHIFFNVFL